MFKVHTWYEYFVLVQNDADSDTGQDKNIDMPDIKLKNEFKKEIKESKKKVLRDETEQPIYPCEECTLCFTTQMDLRVILII